MKKKKCLVHYNLLAISGSVVNGNIFIEWSKPWDIDSLRVFIREENSSITLAENSNVIIHNIMELE